MTQQEHKMIRACHRKLSCIPARHVQFIQDMHSLAEARPFIRLSPKRRQYLSRVYHGLVSQGLAEAS